MFPILVFLSFERSRRYSFSQHENKARELIQDIESAISLDIGKDGFIHLVDPPNSTKGSFEVRGRMRGSFRRTECTWSLSYIFGAPKYELAAPINYVVAITLTQDRQLVLLTPRLAVDYRFIKDPPLRARLDRILQAHGLHASDGSGGSAADF